MKVNLLNKAGCSFTQNYSFTPFLHTKHTKLSKITLYPVFFLSILSCNIFHSKYLYIVIDNYFIVFLFLVNNLCTLLGEIVSVGKHSIGSKGHMLPMTILFSRNRGNE